jgi:hypothetical protein
MNEVGDLVLSTDGEWMVRPPQRCCNGHPITPGRVLVGSVPCVCDRGRHMTWLCEFSINCGSTVYGPVLGPDCSILNGPARIR